MPPEPSTAQARLPPHREAGKIAASANVRAATTPDADAWMARIRQLYDEGKLAEAEKELLASRAAVPDADRRLPLELQVWAKTVEPR